MQPIRGWMSARFRWMAAEPPTDARTVVHRALDRLAGDCPALGIALSGGGDSTALMHLAHDWATPRGVVLRAVTVDHGLRPESGAEARAAGDAAAALGIAHQVLRWDGPGGGNLMAQARAARMALIADWALGHGIAAVALGHTRDDQAETVLMRLMRGAGVDGLSGMAATRRASGILWLRPMLDVSRDALRAELRARNAGWIDDPSNDNAEFDRVRVRQAMAALGLDAGALARTAGDLRSARAALDHAARDTARGFSTDRGSLTLPLSPLLDAPSEIRRRLVAAALRWVNGADYPPRRDPLAHLLDKIGRGRKATLDGVIVRPGAGALRLIREPAAARRAPPSQDGRAWDRRWRVTGLPPGAALCALPPDMLARFDWRASGLSLDQAASTPGVRLPSGRWLAPVLSPGEGCTAAPLRADRAFVSLLSH